MSVAVAVLRAQEDPIGGFENVIGYVIAAVVKQSDGGISLEREVAVHADNAEDNELAESVVKTIERKLNEAFPDPNQRVPEAKLWVPE
jgi:hypothetical protein